MKIALSAEYGRSDTSIRVEISIPNDPRKMAHSELKWHLEAAWKKAVLDTPVRDCDGMPSPSLFVEGYDFYTDYVGGKFNAKLCPIQKVRDSIAAKIREGDWVLRLSTGMYEISFLHRV
jgi:hypothetical protein